MRSHLHEKKHTQKKRTHSNKYKNVKRDLANLVLFFDRMHNCSYELLKYVEKCEKCVRYLKYYGVAITVNYPATGT